MRQLSEGECFTFGLVAFFLMVVSVVGLATSYYRDIHQAAFENGYEQVTVPGVSSAVWQKADTQE